MDPWDPNDPKFYDKRSRHRFTVNGVTNEKVQRKRKHVEIKLKKGLREAGFDSCEICDWKPPKYIHEETDIFMLDYHHVLPVKWGGESNMNNMLLLCPTCHRMADFLSRKHLYYHERSILFQELKSMVADPKNWKPTHVKRITIPPYDTKMTQKENIIRQLAEIEEIQKSCPVVS
jgi:hypothetical protein